jgi:hypothetical protein
MNPNLMGSLSAASAKERIPSANKNPEDINMRPMKNTSFLPILQKRIELIMSLSFP